MTDGEILQLLLNRDERELHEVDLKYGARLLRITEKMIPREDAEECLNEMYLRLWTHIPPDTPGNLYAYMSAILKNLIRDRWRVLHAKQRFFSEVELSAELAETLPDLRFNTEEEAIFRVTDVLNHFLSQLKPVKRNVFLLRYWFDVDVKTISDRTGFSEAKVAKQLYRLKKEFVKFVKEELT